MEFNVADLQEAITERLTDREVLVFRDRRFTWRQLRDRTRRLANVLHAHGLGVHRERSELSPWESGQDHLALYLHNGNEYLEGMLGAFKARVAPFNVNYRYVEEELLYLFRDADSRAVIYHAQFAPLLRAVLPSLPACRLLLQVEDGSGEPLLPGALDYEAALAAAPATPCDVVPSPDDLYIVYTGGTTGMPKGVLWRQADIFVAAFGGRDRDGNEFKTARDVVERACERDRPNRVLPAPPFMHAAAHWTAFSNFFLGNTVVVQGETRRMDPQELLRTVEREKVAVLLIVGDAFATPLLEELDRGSYDLSKLGYIINGGAPLNTMHKNALLDRIPGLRIIDSIGSSESGNQAAHVSSRTRGTSTGSFEPAPGTCVLSEDMTRLLEAGDEALGWFARSGRVPLGYLHDEKKTERTFPMVGGIRYSVPGDRARHRADGVIEVAGRDSVTINSGGEKIFAEEIENTLRALPAVYDAVVVGRPSERWGQEVVALVQLRAGVETTEALLRQGCADHLARYKLPKEIFFLEEIVRSPSGKADYRWARAQLEALDASRRRAQ
jgi:3-oxocholest-4-en-26-oate---CoA ligase